MPDPAALLMRAIGDELTARIIPELKSADAIERANFARLVLQHLAADVDVLPRVAEQLVPEYRSAIRQATALALPASLESHVQAWKRDLDAISQDSGSGRAREVFALRSLGARIVRELTDWSGTNPSDARRQAVQAVLLRLGTLDFRWLTDYDSARNRPAEQAPGEDRQLQPPATGTAEPTPESVTAYLRSHFPSDSDIEATAVVPIPGGRSKKTYFISVRGSNALPAELVMRQDYALRYEGTKVRDEHQPLARLAERGLPVPRPLHLQADESQLGPPFILVGRLSGSAPGSYFGLQSQCPGAFRDLARLLAQLHAVNPRELGFTAPPQSLEQLIDQYERKWRDNATQPSPLIDYAYSWARAQCALDPGSVAAVHGDAGPYNMLVQNDRLTGLLDWEFARAGDPAEDLGIVRVYAEGVMDWQQFLQIYQDAGGRELPERRVQLGMLLQFLKGTTLVAASGRNFVEGWTKEFIKGANAFTGLRLIELRIAALLKRFGAV
jgi:aminoglycoside phosphotransferase (APT) family kinase protein